TAMTPTRIATTLFAALLLAAPATAQDRGGPPGGRRGGGPGPGENVVTSGISWYGTWKDGLAVAKKEKRPILLLAAAPQCHGISGIW
ncbi:MAG: hypothetical protein ACYTG4_10695, partial [Planctomycetota bacterium]